MKKPKQLTPAARLALIKSFARQYQDRREVNKGLRRLLARLK